MEKINTWDLWTENWNNASKFFRSKGNVMTKSRLKDKWYNDFNHMFKDIEEKFQEELTKQLEVKEE